MSYTPPANWLDAWRRAVVDPITRARITTTFGAVARTYHNGDGRSLLVDSSPLLSDIKHSARELDLWKRTVSLEAYSVRLVNAAREVTNFLTANNVIGKRLQLDSGEARLTSLADFALMHDGLVISDWREELGEAVIEAEDPFSFNLDEEREAWWDPGHPLAVVRSMLLAALPASMLGDASLNELSYTDMGHLVVSRHGYNWAVGLLYNTSTSAATYLNNFGKHRKPGIDLLNEVLFLIRGTLRAGGHRTNSAITYLHYDPNGAVHWDLGLDDVANVKPVEIASTKVNHILVEGHSRQVSGDPTSPESLRMPYIVDTDDVSAAAHAWPASATPDPKIYETEEDEIYSPWLNSWGQLFYESNVGFDDVSTTLNIFLPLYFGFAGSSLTDAAGDRVSPPISTIQANHQISVARPAIFLITDHAGNYEFVRSESFAYVTTAFPYTGSPTTRLISTPQGNRTYWTWGRYTLAARGIWGSSPVDWEAIMLSGVTVFVYDLTVASYFGGLVLQRHANGVPIFELDAAPQFYGIEEGDRLSFRDPEVNIPGHNGVDSTVVWEVLKAEDHRLEDTPCIKLRVAFLRDGVIPPATVDPDDWGGEIPTGTLGEYYFDDFGVNYFDALAAFYTNY